MQEQSPRSPIRPLSKKHSTATAAGQHVEIRHRSVSDAFPTNNGNIEVLPVTDDEIVIQELRKEDVGALAELYEAGIPHAVFCAMGRRFTAKFFGWLAEREDVCSLVGLSGDGRLLGVIVGTLHRSDGYRSVLREHRWSLLVAAGWRLLSPRVLRWIIAGVVGKLRRAPKGLELSDAELLLIAVCPKVRGRGLAERFVNAMESRFRKMGFTGEYAIHTEASNTRANRFYERIGAILVASEQRRGLLINSYRKAIGTSAASDKES